MGAVGEHLLAEPRGPGQAARPLSLKQQQVLDAVPVATGATDASIARVAGLALPEVTTALGRLHAARPGRAGRGMAGGSPRSAHA